MGTSVNEAKNAAREYVQLTRTNKVETAVTVVSKSIGDARQKMKDGVPVLDKDGNELFYPAPLSCKVIFTGGEDEISLTKEQFDKIKHGEMYMFIGRRGMVREFGRESMGIVYDSIEEL